MKTETKTRRDWEKRREHHPPIRENSGIVREEEQSLFEAIQELFSFIRTKAYFEKLIAEGRVAVNGEIINRKNGEKNHQIQVLNPERSKVHAGDKITIFTEQKDEPPADLSYDVLWEDNDILIVSKSGNCPVHPAGKYYFNSLQVQLERDGFGKVNPAHRIDRETSGAVIFAKNKEILVEFHKLFARSEVEKTYLAVVFGRFKSSQGTFNCPLLKKTIHAFRDIVVCDDEGKEAKTHYKVLGVSTTAECSLLELHLEKGRKHQIRVHCAHSGHPLVGDALYGRGSDIFLKYHEALRQGDNFNDEKILELRKQLEEKVLAKRQLLHAETLRFKHPRTKEEIQVKASLPKDFKEFIEKEFPQRKRK